MDRPESRTRKYEVPAYQSNNSLCSVLFRIFIDDGSFVISVDLLSAATFLLLTLATGIAAVAARPILEGAAAHGKRSLAGTSSDQRCCRIATEGTVLESILKAFTGIVVPKSYFTQMYIVGVVVSSVCICLQINTYGFIRWIGTITAQSTLCFLVHCKRPSSASLCILFCLTVSTYLFMY